MQDSRQFEESYCLALHYINVPLIVVDLHRVAPAMKLAGEMEILAYI